jgi:hypothetical protein
MSIDPALPPESAASEREPFHRRVLERVRALPGVDAASLSVLTPLSGRDTGRSIAVQGFEPRDETDRIVHLNHVSEDYFRTFGVKIVAGRAFAPDDAGPAAKVAVLNEAAARAYFAGRSPIGATIELGSANLYTVVGVVSNYKHMSLREPAPRFVFVPLWQPADPLSRVTLAVASGLPAAGLTRLVISKVTNVHARTLVSDVVDVERQIDATLIGERLLSRLAGGFAALALVLASIGVYGTLNCSVARRRPELGIRLALGARPGHVASTIVRQTMTPAALGLLLGLPLALVVARTAEQMLFGLSALDPARRAGRRRSTRLRAYEPNEPSRHRLGLPALDCATAAPRALTWPEARSPQPEAGIESFFWRCS